MSRVWSDLSRSTYLCKVSKLMLQTVFGQFKGDTQNLLFPSAVYFQQAFARDTDPTEPVVSED